MLNTWYADDLTKKEGKWRLNIHTGQYETGATHLSRASNHTGKNHLKALKR